jgi:hypothetical protein
MSAGMPIGFVSESKCQLECLLALLANQNASWKAEHFFSMAKVLQFSARRPQGKRTVLATNTRARTHTLIVLAQRFACES